MFDIAEYTNYIVITLWILPALFCVVLAYRFAGQQHLAIVHPMIIVLTGGILFCMGAAGELYADDVKNLVLWVKIEYIGISLIPAGWLSLAYTFDAKYKNKDDGLSVRQYLLLLLPSAILLLMVWTNEFHHLYWEETFVEDRFGFQMLGTKRGYLPYIWEMYSYSLYFYAVFTFAKIVINSKGLYRNQALSMLLAFSFPFSFSLANSFGFWPYIDVTAPIGGLTCIVIVFIIVKFRLLEISPALRRVIMLKMPDPLIAVNEVGEVMDYNDLAQSMLFKSPILQSHTPLRKVLNTQWQPLANLMESDEDISTLMLSDKTWQVRKMRLDPIEDVGFIFSLQDITSQVESDRKLIQVEERLESLLAVLPVPVFRAEFSDGCEVRMSNRAFSQLFGEGLANQPSRLYDLVDEPSRLDELRESLSASGAIQQEDIVMRSEQGELLECAITAAVRIEKPSGEAYLEGIIEDVAARNEAKRELIEAKNLAEQASELKTTFLANMSHEIRTPLNGIIPPAEILSRTRLTPDQRASVEIIQKSGSVLSRLLNDLLDISKIEANRLSLEHKPLFLASTVRQAVDRHSTKAYVDDVTLSVEFHFPESIRVFGDSLRINQVVENLVSNAIKFSPNGTVVVDVFLDELNNDSSQARIEVTDTGIGIEPELLESIFKPFTQADTSTTRFFGGTGLGLTICRSLMNLMQGEISAQSSPGAGSRFVVTFPVEVTQSDVAIDEVSEAELADLSGAKILVAEDNLMNQVIITEQLAQLKVEPTIVSDGQEAIDAVAADNFDVILMDCHMPVKDGYQAAKELRDLGCVTPIIALTANAGNLEDEKSREHGMNLHLTKPISLIELSKALCEYVV